MKFFRAPRVGVGDLVVVGFLVWAVWFVAPGVAGWARDRVVGWATGGTGVPSFQPWAHGFGNGAVLPSGQVPPWVSTLVQDARVERIVDGDTLDVLTPAAVVKRVRLLGVDTPERGECWAREATAELERLAPVGTRVTLAGERGQGDVDRYGRLLAYVYSAGVDGPDSVNRGLVVAGAARAYRYRRAVRFDASFRVAEREARAAGVGRWGSC